MILFAVIFVGGLVTLSVPLFVVVTLVRQERRGLPAWAELWNARAVELAAERAAELVNR